MSSVVINKKPFAFISAPATKRVERLPKSTELRREAGETCTPADEQRKNAVAGGGRNMSIRPFLSGQEFDPETIQKMAEGSMG
jgi:hypothetical protein